jgi:hypothetical protein
MVKIMNFGEFLNEGLSEILFHYTTLTAAVSIIHGNTFALLPVVTDEIDAKLNRGKMYFMSFTRSGTRSAYEETKIGAIVGANCSVRLVVDGVQLRSRVSGGPVKYTGADEMEDRIFSDKRTVSGARKMLKEVHVYMSEKNYKGKEKDVNQVNDLKDECTEHHITMKFFGKKEEFDFAVPKKLRGEPIPGRHEENEEAVVGEDDIKYKVEDYEELLAWISIAGGSIDSLLKDKTFKEHLEHLDKSMAQSKSDIEKRKDSILGEDPYDAAHGLQTLFVNHRKYNRGYINGAIESIVSLMKSAKTNTVTTFVYDLIGNKKAAA